MGRGPAGAEVIIGEGDAETWSKYIIYTFKDITMKLIFTINPPNQKIMKTFVILFIKNIMHNMLYKYIAFLNEVRMVHPRLKSRVSGVLLLVVIILFVVLFFL